MKEGDTELNTISIYKYSSSSSSINLVPKFQNSKAVLLGWKVNSVVGCDEGS